MAGSEWNPWKLGVIAAAVIVTTAVVTSLVVGNWSHQEAGKPTTTTVTGAPAVPKTARQTANPRPQAEAPRPVAQTPSQSDIQACNDYAKSVSSGDKTKDVLTKGLIGGALGAVVGTAGGAIAGGGKGAGKGAAIGGIVGATAGTLYGLNGANQNDARATQAYRTCMRDRGYTS